MAPVKHGAYINGKPTKLYRVWLTMRSRCTNPKVDSYHRYGGRGIRVCEQWNDFTKFKDDIGESPGLKYSLDRFPNKDGDYEPGNVRWATDEEQANNKDGLHLIPLPDGRKLSIAMAAREMKISVYALKARIRNGWKEEHLFDPVIPQSGNKKGRPTRSTKNTYDQSSPR
jgi:hypothetical protein